MQELKDFYIERTVPLMVPERAWSYSRVERTKQREAAAKECGVVYQSTWTDLFFHRVQNIPFTEDDYKSMEWILRVRRDVAITDFFIEELFKGKVGEVEKNNFLAEITPYILEKNITLPNKIGKSIEDYENVHVKIMEAIREFIGTVKRDHIKTEGKIYFQWFIIGDPYLCRYTDTMDDRKINFIIKPSLNEKLRKKLILIPVVRDENCKDLSVFRIDRDETMKAQIQNGELRGIEYHEKFVYTLPIAALFTFDNFHPPEAIPITIPDASSPV